MNPPGLLLAFVLASPLAADGPQPATVAPATIERYYMTLFGTQAVPPRIRYTHTWATFVRTAVTSTGEVPVAVDTISWMPATLQIRPFALRREPGVNLTGPQTLQWTATFDGRASSWGPYEIDAAHYGRFLARKAELEGGEIAYRAIGALTQRGTVSNCGQSFARSSPVVGEYLEPTPAPGETGTSLLAARYVKAGTILNGGMTHPWLLPVVGAYDYPITPRQPGERIPIFFRPR